MTTDETAASIIDLTADGVEFASWSTIVENDDLHLGRLSFDLGSPLVTYVQERLTYALPAADHLQGQELQASYVSKEKGTIIRFGFRDVVAFRVLDEDGLLELWNASSLAPRPAQTTFRARGHAWASESLLVFLSEEQTARFSYFVVTAGWCLEVVCRAEPVVAEVGAAIVQLVRTNDC